MRKVYTSIILLITMLFGAMTIAQEQQKNYINYQGVARKADGTLMNGESLVIGVKLKFGSSSSSEIAYEESHSLTTDANGVFSLLIGNGSPVVGDYINLPWGEFATYAAVSINGNEIGTTELMAVPHALSSADNQWHTMGNDIENKNGGNVFVTGSLYASKDFSLAEGTAVNEFSTDITLGSNSDEIVPTQKAVKTYVDSQLGGSGGGADDQTAVEVAYDNSTSGLSANTAQAAIDELVTGGAVDADSDPNNEIQTLSFDVATSELSLTDGGSITLPSGGTDDDADPNNEIQDISLSGTELTISNGSTIDLAPIVPPGGTDDQNASEVPFDNTGTGLAASDTQAAIEELASGGLVDTDDQDLSLSGTTLQITDGTGVDLSTIIPPGGTDDQNAGEVPYDNTASGLAASDAQAAIDELASGGLVDTDDQALELTGDILTIEDGAGSVDLSVYKDADITSKTGILIGDGTNVSGLIGTADGQVVKWNAGTSNWEAGADEIGGGGGSSLWTDNGGDIYYNSGKVGVGTNTPESSIAIKTNGNQWNLSSTEGDFRIGDATHRLKIGVATAGGGAGDARIRVEGGTDRMMLGGGTNDVLTITDQNVGVGTITPSAKLDVDGNIRSSDLSGGGNVAADANGNLIIGGGGGGGGGGSSLWSENGSNIHFNGGNVGVGTDNPTAPLEISTSMTRPFVLKSTADDNFMQYITPAGFVGYSGVWTGNRDIDFGTTTSNSAGKVHLTTKATPKLTVAADGDIGIGTTSPTAKLDVKGDIKTSGEINRPSTGNTNMLPIAYGSINGFDGSIFTGSGNFTVTRLEVGVYAIVIDGEAYDFRNYVSQATFGAAIPGFINLSSTTAPTDTLLVYLHGTDGASKDGLFTFVTYKP